MAWTNKQRQIAARACQAARLSDVQRRDVVLRQFPNAHVDGKVTSTAPKLTNADFEQFMAIIEGYAGGKVLHFAAGYWKAQAADQFHRMRGRARRAAAVLEEAGLLKPGAGLAGWIEKRVTRGETNKLEELDYHGLLALITGLEAFARQRGIGSPPPQRGPLSDDPAGPTVDVAPPAAPEGGQTAQAQFWP